MSINRKRINKLVDSYKGILLSKKGDERQAVKQHRRILTICWVKESDTKAHSVQFHWHGILKYAQLTYNDRNQIRGWFWVGNWLQQGTGTFCGDGNRNSESPGWGWLRLPSVCVVKADSTARWLWLDARGTSIPGSHFWLFVSQTQIKRNLDGWGRERAGNGTRPRVLCSWRNSDRKERWHVQDDTG